MWQLIVVIAHSLWACLWLKHCSVQWFNSCGIMTTFSVDNFCLNFSALQTGNYSADRSLNWFAVILVLHAVNHRVRLVNCPIAVSAAIAWNCGVPKVNLLWFVFIRKRACIPKNERKGFVCSRFYTIFTQDIDNRKLEDVRQGKICFPSCLCKFFQRIKALCQQEGHPFQNMS